MAGVDAKNTRFFEDPVARSQARLRGNYGSGVSATKLNFMTGGGVSYAHFRADVRAHTPEPPCDGVENRCYFGAMRIAPSRRMTSPFSISFSKMWRTSDAYSGGRPRREGKGTCSASDSRAA